MTLTIGETLEVTAHETDMFGQGVARVDDFVIFVKGLIKDEKALVTIKSVKKHFAEATIKKLLITTSDRRSVASKLGALDLYHMRDDAQVLWQTQITENHFKRKLGYDKPITETIHSTNTLNYRNKVVYHVLETPLLTLGMYEADPIQLKEVHTFILNSHAIQRCVAKLQQQTIEVDSSILKHIVFRSNEKEQVLVTLVAKEKSFKGLDVIIEKMKTFKEVIGLTLNIKPSDQIILGHESYLLFGKNQISFDLGKLKLSLSDQSFMQVNTEVMLKTYERIRKEIDNDYVIDCYSGIGSIGFYIGDKARKVLMIDNNLANVEAARENIKRHSGNFEVIHATAESILPKLTGDVLIIDPPRAGLHKSLLSALKQKAFKKLIYLSCELSTLTRDIDALQETYGINEVIPVRMFPQTTSIETLVILENKKNQSQN